jgi:nicotinate phosphoribosyltransferase
VYKLVRYEDRDVLKLSEGKETWVGAKALYRFPDEDVLALAEEGAPRDGAESLLYPVMRGGELLRPHPPLAELRARCQEQLAALPAAVLRLDRAETHPVRVSAALRARQAAAKAKVTR